MKRLIVIATALLVAGCNSDTSDLQAFTQEVQRTAAPEPEQMPAIPNFIHVDYSAMALRSPFVIPRPEVIQESLATVQDCLTPDPGRRKQPLERYSLDNLTMRGTLGMESELWALVEASDGSLHRVKEGNFLGLYHGKIRIVSQHQIALMELIPDGTGCWKERETVLAMVDPE